MTWDKLRIELRQRFGSHFGFYNDKYRSGIRRIKIETHQPQEFYLYIKEIAPELDINLYKPYPGSRNRVTIHYNK